jgi:ribosomal-protein-alanine N-acetyltransferase
LISTRLYGGLTGRPKEEFSMSDLPRLYTPRLCLRPLSLADAPRLQELAGDKRVAQMTALIPHPYPDGDAEKFIRTTADAAAADAQFTWAVTLAGTRTPGREHVIGETGHLIGVMGIGRHGAPEHGRGTLGYWIGVPY